MQYRKGPAKAGNDNLSAMGPKERPRAASARLSSSLRFFLAVLAVVFAAETGVMFLLPVVVADPHGHAAILVDSSVLTVLSAPPIWWLITQRRRAGQALQRSEEHFRSLIENASDIITVLGKDGAISFVSPSSRRVLGYEAEELIGQNVFNFVHPDDLTSTLANFSHLLQNHGGEQSAEFRFRHADGSWRVLEAIGRNALHDPAAAALIINSRDITEHKQAEDALRESEERFRAFMDNSPAVAFMKDEEGRFVYLNQPFRNAFGVKEKEWLGKTDFDVFPLETANQNRQNDLSVLSSDGPLETVEVVPVADGDLHHWIVFKFPVRSASGERFLGGMAVDITERKQTEDALRQSEEQTRRIVETAYDALISLDAGGVITAWNGAAETIFGWSREEAIGRTLADTIVPEQLREGHVEGVKRFLATGEGPVLNTRIEITALHRDGHEFPVELAVWAVRSGESWTFHAFVHDVTERKRAEETLRQLNRALEEERNAVRDFNRLLETRVRDRTQDLRHANLELRERNRQLLDARAQAATDGLTSLPNHRSFHERIREAVSAAATTGASVSAIMLDIDHFKTVNDELGHLAGDEILRACGEILAAATGAENVYRYGGDEFALILDNTDIDRATVIAEELRTAIESRSNDLRGITISLGVAEFPNTSQSAEELIYRADAAMYTAKSAGKNRTSRWDRMPSPRSRTTQRRSAPVH